MKQAEQKNMIPDWVKISLLAVTTTAVLVVMVCPIWKITGPIILVPVFFAYIIGTFHCALVDWAFEICKNHSCLGCKKDKDPKSGDE